MGVVGADRAERYRAPATDSQVVQIGSSVRLCLAASVGPAVSGMLSFVRWMASALLLVVVAGCTADASSTSVIPEAVEVSSDRRTVAVRTGYPASLNCGKDPGGLTVEVEGDIATVDAVMAETGADRCTLECGAVTQSVTLSEPLPEGVQLETPSNAEPGCGGVSELFVASDSIPPEEPCQRPAAAASEVDRSLIPVPPPPSDTGREEFGAEVIRTLTPMVVGADAGSTVAQLRAAGWTVTVGERTQTSTTATPDLLWSRLTITTCDGLVDEVTFD